MARRLCLSLDVLRRLDVGACATDARVLAREGDESSLSVRTRFGDFNLCLSGTRELRLLGKQMMWFAEYLSRDLDELVPADCEHKSVCFCTWYDASGLMHEGDHYTCLDCEARVERDPEREVKTIGRACASCVAAGGRRWP